jgi:MFS family permease
MPAAMTVFAPFAGRFVARHGARLPLFAGGAALAMGSAAIARYLGGTAPGSITLMFALFGAGAGLCSPAITNTIMGGLPNTQAAVASSIASASRQLGATLGTAITGTVLIASLRGTLHGGYIRACHPAWWLTVGFGAVILPLALAAARRRAQHARARRPLRPGRAATPVPALGAGSAGPARALNGVQRSSSPAS